MSSNMSLRVVFEKRERLIIACCVISKPIESFLDTIVDVGIGPKG